MGPVNEYADQYRRYLPRILHYIRLRVGEEELAQDLTSEVFERALSRQHTLRNPAAFGGWLFAIARTTVAGHYRRKQPILPLEAVADRSSPDPTPPEAAMQREELVQLRMAMVTLSEREQEILRLKFVGGLGNQEIGHVLRLRGEHVAVLLYRALRKLRSRLAEEELGPETQRRSEARELEASGAPR